MRRRDLEDVAIGDRFHLMDGPRKIAIGLAGLEPDIEQLVLDLDAIDHLAREQVNRLVLQVVILERERMSGFDMQDFAHIDVGMRPDRLMAPGLRDGADGMSATHHRSLNEKVHRHAAACDPPDRPAASAGCATRNGISTRSATSWS